MAFRLPLVKRYQTACRLDFRASAPKIQNTNWRANLSFISFTLTNPKPKPEREREREREREKKLEFLGTVA
jgi:hypothetical protein